MKILLRALAASVSAAVLLGCTSQEQPSPGPDASATSSATPAPSATSVTTEALFNDPWGSPAEQRTLLTAQVKAIRQAPKGATITLLAYSISDASVVNSLIKASRRGVAVRILLSDHGDYRRGNWLTRKLGTDTTKASYVTKCHLACASDVTYPNPVTGALTRPYMHAKAMAISTTGSDQWVVMVPSGNLTVDSTENQANDLLIVRKDQTLYDFVVDRFEVMRKDAGGTAASIESGTIGMRLFPEVPKIPKSGTLPSPDPDNDPYAELLDDVTCVVDGIATRIDIAMYMWTNPRRYLARRVARLSASGCDVRVIGTPDEEGRDGEVWDPQIRKTLLTRGDVELRQIDVASNRVLHTKIVLIDGWDADGNRITRTASGSPNLIAQALLWSDELAWYSTEPEILDAERDWIDGVLVEHSRRVH